MHLSLILEMRVADDPDRVVASGSDGYDLTASGLLQLATEAARLFRGTGKSRVGYLHPNSLALPIAFFGAMLAGMPFVPINYRLGDKQLHSIARARAGDTTWVAGDEARLRLTRFGDTDIFAPQSLIQPANLAAPVFPRSDTLSADEPTIIIYTSGTTALPKAAVLRHRHLASYIFSTVDFGAAGSEAAALLSVPPYHIAGVMNLLTNMYMGRRVVYLEPFDPHRWLATVREEKITHAMVVPTMLDRIVTSVEGPEADVPSLQTISYGGAKTSRGLIERALQLFPSVAFTSAYGLTETSSTISILGPDDHRAATASDDPAVRARLESTGRPVPGIAVEVRDEAGRVCGPNEVGGIYVRGDQVSGEYLDSSRVGHEWFGTRDRGWFDEEGYLFVAGRADDTIIRGGENIAPAEIEEVILGHPDVIGCAVVGLDDEEWGQRIAAAVVLAPGSSCPEDELRNYARTRLRSSKTPDTIAFVDGLPYTETGKLLRRAVRKTFESSSTSD